MVFESPQKSIQNKIDEIMEDARTKGLPARRSSAKVSNTEDRLLKIIRNQKEADVFMAGLRAAITAVISQR